MTKKARRVRVVREDIPQRVQGRADFGGVSIVSQLKPETSSGGCAGATGAGST